VLNILVELCLLRLCVFVLLLLLNTSINSLNVFLKADYKLTATLNISHWSLTAPTTYLLLFLVD